jgi:Nucleotidyl transferase AbiEii toxin, Type IV TA system
MVPDDAPAMNEVIRAAAELQAVCVAERWRYCFIGGLAVQRWGEPRETVDVDLTLVTGFGRETPFVTALLDRFEPRIPNAATFALDTRVLLLRAASGVGLDVALGGLPFEEEAVARSTMFTFPPDVPLRTCSAEDLLVLKAFADRPKDWVDIDGIIIRQGGALDWDYVQRQLAPLVELKEEPRILARLSQRRTELNR